LPPPASRPTTPRQPAATLVQRNDDTFHLPFSYRRRRRVWPKVVLAVVMVFGGVAAFRVIDARINEQAASAEAPGIDDTVTTTTFDLTLLQVQDPFVSPNPFEQPQPGRRHVAVNLRLVNTNDSPAEVVNSLRFEVLDSLGQPWPPALAGLDLPQLGVELGPGGTLEGWAVFEVAVDSGELRLEITDMVDSTAHSFTLSPTDPTTSSLP
jgi:hypothetical protein